MDNYALELLEKGYSEPPPRYAGDLHSDGRHIGIRHKDLDLVWDLKPELKPEEDRKTAHAVKDWFEKQHPKHQKLLSRFMKPIFQSPNRFLRYGTDVVGGTEVPRLRHLLQVATKDPNAKLNLISPNSLTLTVGRHGSLEKISHFKFDLQNNVAKSEILLYNDIYVYYKDEEGNRYKFSYGDDGRLAKREIEGSVEKSLGLQEQRASDGIVLDRVLRLFECARWLRCGTNNDEERNEGSNEALLRSESLLLKEKLVKAFSDRIEIPKKDFIKEHKKLIGILRSPSHKDDLEEAKEQQKELKEQVRKKIKKSEYFAGKLESLDKMSRPKLRFPNFGVDPRSEQNVQLIQTGKQAEMFGRKTANQNIPDLEFRQTPSSSPQKYSTQQQREEEAKKIANSFSSTVVGLNYPPAQAILGGRDAGKFKLSPRKPKSYQSALAGKLRSKFENFDDTYEQRLKAHKEKKSQVEKQHAQNLSEWWSKRPSNLSTAEMEKWRSEKPVMPRLRAPSKKVVETKKMGRQTKDVSGKKHYTVSLRGKSIEGTIEHEAVHGVFDQIERKYGREASIKARNHILSAFDKPTLESIAKFVASRSYKPQSPNFPEEMVTHARDILVNPVRRENFMNSLGNITPEEKQLIVSKIKKGWEEAYRRSQNLKPEDLVNKAENLKIKKRYSPQFDKAKQILSTLPDEHLDNQTSAVATLRQARLHDMADHVQSMHPDEYQDFVVNHLSDDEDDLEMSELLMKPYVSEAQRRWAHTAAGKKALGGEKAVRHWDKATKGKKLPEKVAKVEYFKSKLSKALPQKKPEFHSRSEIESYIAHMWKGYNDLFGDVDMPMPEYHAAPQYELTRIPLNQIPNDSAPNKFLVERYKKEYQKGSDFPPVVLSKVKNQIVDGRHRIQAARELGHTHIMAYVPVANSEPVTKSEELSNEYDNLLLRHYPKQFVDMVKRGDQQYAQYLGAPISHEKHGNLIVKYADGPQNLGIMGLFSATGRVRPSDAKGLKQWLGKVRSSLDSGKNVYVSLNHHSEPLFMRTLEGGNFNVETLSTHDYPWGNWKTVKVSKANPVNDSDTEKSELAKGAINSLQDYEIRHEKDRFDASLGRNGKTLRVVSLYHKPTGQKAGQHIYYSVWHPKTGNYTHHTQDISIAPEHRRKGLASALYVYAEKSGPNDKMVRTKNLTAEGKALWNQPNRPFGKSELEKAKEDIKVHPAQRKQFRQERRSFEGQDPLAQDPTNKLGVSDIGIETRRADPKQQGVFAHGYARIGDPEWHGQRAKNYHKKLLNALRQQQKANLGKSELEKGSFQRRNPFDPQKMPKKNKEAIAHWQYWDKGRNDISRDEGNIRNRFLHKLSGKTQVRRAPDGKREFLLHRGESDWRNEGYNPTQFDDKSHYSSENTTSWTPNYDTAKSFASEGLPADRIHSAWIHEDKILTIPKQYGFLHMKDSNKPNPVDSIRGPNELADEYEVIVGAGSFPKANQPNLKSELEKGSWQKKNPYNPSDKPDRYDRHQKVNLSNWQHDAQQEDRDLIMPDVGAVRKRFLRNLATKTKTRLKNGKREYLLHRGHGDNDPMSETDTHITHTKNSSWTPNYNTAQVFKLHREQDGSINPRITSAWINEDNILSIPKQYGNLDRTGANKYDYEHEVIVAPHTSEKVPYQHFKFTDVNPDINARITQRGQSGYSHFQNLRNTLNARKRARS